MAAIAPVKTVWNPALSVNVKVGASGFSTGQSGGDTVANDGQTLLVVQNVHGSLARTININSQIESEYGVDSDLSFALAAGDIVILGPFDVARFNDANGNLALTYANSGADGADLRIKALRPANPRSGK